MKISVNLNEYDMLIIVGLLTEEIVNLKRNRPKNPSDRGIYNYHKRNLLKIRKEFYKYYKW